MGWSPFRQTGLTHHHPPKSFKGYTLITPLEGQDVLLLDMNGAVVHRWRVDNSRAAYARLLPGGNLLYTGAPPREGPPPREPSDMAALPIEERVQWLGGSAPQLREYSWHGELVWEYDNPLIHHDALRLDNGHTLLLRYYDMDPDKAHGVRGGTDRRRRYPMLSDVVFEIDGDGNEIWSADVADYMDPVKDPVGVFEQRLEWTHCNSVDADDSRILLSSRHNSRVLIINRQTKELEWKYRDAFQQHDARLLENGNVLMFNNGASRPGMTHSRVVEVSPKDNEIKWEYYGSPALSFFSPFISGAERLPNGNTLICEGASGRLFETTREREIVWEWISPFTHPLGRDVVAMLYRPHRIGPDDPRLADRDLDPERHRAFNQLHGLA